MFTPEQFDAIMRKFDELHSDLRGSSDRAGSIAGQLDALKAKVARLPTVRDYVLAALAGYGVSAIGVAAVVLLLYFGRG